MDGWSKRSEIELTFKGRLFCLWVLVTSSEVHFSQVLPPVFFFLFNPYLPLDSASSRKKKKRSLRTAGNLNIHKYKSILTAL